MLGSLRNILEKLATAPQLSLLLVAAKLNFLVQPAEFEPTI